MALGDEKLVNLQNSDKFNLISGLKYIGRLG
jgi:hypothetical protein